MPESNPTNPPEAEPESENDVLKTLAEDIIRRLNARVVMMLVTFPGDAQHVTAFTPGVTRQEAMSAGLDAASAAHNMMRQIIELPSDKPKEEEKDGIRSDDSGSPEPDGERAGG